MTTHRLGYNARISAEMGLNRFRTSEVKLRVTDSAEWDIAMYPSQAREVARQLKRAADYIDPPKPRKTKA